MGTGAQPSSQGLQFWLRAWEIDITTPQGTYTITNGQPGCESLRVSFNVEMYAYPLQAFWQAEVVIYNLSAAIAKQILQSSTSIGRAWNFAQPIAMGDSVSISAGYQYTGSGTFNPAAQLLYKGRVFQSIWTRENVTDYKLTLRLITALVEDLWNVANIPLGPGTSDLEKVNQVTKYSTNEIPIERIDDAASAILDQHKLPGSQALRDRPLSIIEDVAYQHNLYSWISWKGLNIRSFGPSDFKNLPAYAYGPPDLPGSYAPTGTTTGQIHKTLIGVPQQTQDGVTFRVLMDSTPRVGDVVQLAPGTIINPVALQYGGNTLPPIPSGSGLYIVARLHHVGDSRGNDWYTEILGMSDDYFNQFLSSRTVGNIMAGVQAGLQFAFGP